MSFTEKRAARADRMRTRAAEKRTEADTLHAANRKIGEVMNGTPVLKGDDPDALEKLRAALATAEERHTRMVKGNAVLRKAESVTIAAFDLKFLGFSDAEIGRALMKLGPSSPWYGFPTVNSAAEIRRLKARIKTLEAAPTKARPDVVKNGVKVSWNVEMNRVQITFPKKWDVVTRAQLRAYGFRWAPSVGLAGVWQRNATEDAWTAALEIATFAPPVGTP